MVQFTNKLVVIVNKDIEIGVAMNAVAHASLAIGALLGKEAMFLQDYKDASGNVWPMSGMPYIVLRGKSGEIRKAIAAAQEANILHHAFTETMTSGGYEEQLVRTAQVQQDDHHYYAAVLWGPWETVSQVSRRFSLYK
jgi:hypothetical protein